FRAVQFLRALQRVGADLRYRRLMRRFPDIVVASKCHDGDPLIRLELECRILARQAPDLIAEHLEVPSSMVVAYKLFFYDIDDRIDAMSFIQHQIIGTAPCEANSPEKHMKLFVYNHGAAAIEPWLDYLR